MKNPRPGSGEGAAPCRYHPSPLCRSDPGRRRVPSPMGGEKWPRGPPEVARCFGKVGAEPFSSSTCGDGARPGFSRAPFGPNGCLQFAGVPWVWPGSRVAPWRSPPPRPSPTRGRTPPPFTLLTVEDDPPSPPAPPGASPRGPPAKGVSPGLRAPERSGSSPSTPFEAPLTPPARHRKKAQSRLPDSDRLISGTSGRVSHASPRRGVAARPHHFPKREC